MATTALFMEILIVGLESLVWLCLLLLALVGSDPVGSLHLRERATIYKDWATLITTLAIAAAYVLGVLVDRAADSFYRRFERTLPGRLANWCLGKGSYWYELPARIPEMRLCIMHKSSGVASFIEYQRSRVRIARATVFNVGLVLLFGGIYWGCRSHTDMRLTVGLASIGLVLFALSLFASERIHTAYLRRLSDAYCLVQSLPPWESLDGVVAAICYRENAGQLQLLLVRTKSGDKWTFPKGHIERCERTRPWEAATREAREEAGVVGTPDERPIAYYLYPRPPSDSSRLDDRIAAYLLRVTSEQDPTEAFREPRWFTVAEARARLAEGGRERRYRRGHHRVVNAATQALAKRVNYPP